MTSTVLSNLFHLGPPIAEKILRPIIVYAFLIVGLRLAGKREMAQLNPFDLVVLLTLSNTAQNAIIGEDNSVSLQPQSHRPVHRGQSHGPDRQRRHQARSSAKGADHRGRG